ncbi:cytochrome p450 family 4 [Holotrichia oblita]|uniref:Cytochrome p450 family 4 n=1 Tax=Holotrichia oblita TaxID=644536 RepID=A0ACB9TBW0_HOLOL|nr:cytochrome p450 family 4 [Holotrichia oblita]
MLSEMYCIELVLVIVFVWYLYSYFKWRKDVYYPLEKIPGHPRYPIIGTEYIFIRVSSEELFDVFLKVTQKYAPLFRRWNGSLPEIVTTKPEHFEIIMSSPNYITKGQFYNNVHDWLGQGLLTSTGNRWLQHRKLITPTFHFKILENYMNVFVAKTELFLNILDRKADGAVHNIYSDITHCALDIICESAMGVNINAMYNDDNEYVKCVYEISEIIVWKSLRPYIPRFIFNLLPIGRRLKKDLKILHGFSDKVISDRKKLLKYKQGNKSHNDVIEKEVLGRKKRLSFLDLLIEASEDGKVLSDIDIRQEVDTFMFEGHDTTSASLSWTLLLLGNHPDIQERVFEEVRNVLHDKLTPTSINELNEFKYLERVIKESLRLYPSVPIVMRHTKEEIQMDEYKIPPNVDVVLLIYCVHRDPKVYPNPEKFDPDRFLHENSVNIHPYAYVPFSAGHRNCVESAMGVNVDAMLNDDNEYVKSIYEFNEIILWKSLRPYLPTFIFNLLPTGRRMKNALKILHGFSEKVISDRKALLKQKQRNGSTYDSNDEILLGIKRRLSFLDLLIEASENGKVLNDIDIRQEEQVFEEVRNVLRNRSTPRSIAELNELKYLERVIKESLRLYPSVPFIIRQTKEEVQIDKYKIPANVEVFLGIYSVHRDPEIYPDPEKFDPDRFLPENSVNRHPYAYIPFSAGPRNCVGQKFALYEEKTILASIINRYKIIAVEKIEDIQIYVELIMRPANGVLLKLEKRL